MQSLLPDPPPASNDSGRLPPTIWYMGVKSRLLPDFLDRILEAEVPPGGVVVDLFSGTGIVSAHCAGRYRTIANDVQRYAHIIAKSLIEHDPEERQAFLAGLDLERDLLPACRRNQRALRSLYGPVLEEEERRLRALEGPGAAAALEDYRRFLRQPGLLHGDTRTPAPIHAALARRVSDAGLKRHRADPRCKPYRLMAAYYANVYFGVRQALELDSIRCAIDALPGSGRFAEALRTHCLAALLHAASVCTSGTSHFAQPRQLTKDSEVLAMARRRRLGIWESFARFSREISAAVASIPYRPGNRTLCGDYRDLIEEDGPRLRFRKEARGDLVYADPPYTSDNYSRFYHVLEVLADYDYPELHRNGQGEVLCGRYTVPDRRFQSGFCSPGSVEEEFIRVIEAAAGSGSKLVISYGSPNGLLLKVYKRRHPKADPVRQLEDLCRRSYSKVQTLRRNLLHSGQGDKNKPTVELLLICTGPRAG